MQLATELSIGQSATIARLAQTPLALKLLELGCLPGVNIILLRIAPLGSPYYFKIGEHLNLALRKNEADEIFITIDK